VYTTFFLSPRYGHGFYWGVGPGSLYPTATSSALGVDKWATGPSAAFLKQDESPLVFGAVVNNILVSRRPARQRPDQPAAVQPDRHLSFRR